MRAPVQLKVTFTGIPTPEAAWFYNGKPLQPREGSSIVNEEGVTALVIDEAEKKDSGKYEVRVTNEGGEARSSGSLRVVGKPLCSTPFHHLY